tara:strand:- start:43 stop:624 length:582 start_codon:yes stop_codon:yes gene_type:complete
MENITGEKEMKKKCTQCGKVKSLKKDFYTNPSRKDGYHSECKICGLKYTAKYRNTEIGYLKHRYDNMRRNLNSDRRPNQNSCHFTFDEFFAAWKRHKSIYGMKSAWGPGVDHLEQHLPITIITRGTKRVKGTKIPRVYSNLSADRLDSSRDYTLQNLIFIRVDENVRKKDTSYKDCKIQIRLHEERFIKMKAI